MDQNAKGRSCDEQSFTSQPNKRCVMRGYTKIAVVSILMMGLLAVPNLSPAADGSSNGDGKGRHSLLNTELRSKIEHLRDKIADHREDQHNHGGMPGSLEALQTQVTSLKTDLATANGLLSSLAVRLKALETAPASTPSTSPALTELAKYVTVDPNTLNGVKGPHVIFHHANVHVQSGSGTTFEAGGLTGLGNLIVGYNELPVPSGGSRGGSHNLVVGPSHAFTSMGGVVFGTSNLISGQYGTILGGNLNRSEGTTSSILGGYGLVVSGTEETYP
jgi:hypothetical protein